MELSSRKLKNYFLKKLLKTFFLKKNSCILGGNLQSLKAKKICSEEISCISPKKFTTHLGMTGKRKNILTLICSKIIFLSLRFCLPKPF